METTRGNGAIGLSRCAGDECESLCARCGRWSLRQCSLAERREERTSTHMELWGGCAGVGIAPFLAGRNAAGTIEERAIAQRDIGMHERRAYGRRHRIARHSLPRCEEKQFHNRDSITGDFAKGKNLLRSACLSDSWRREARPGAPSNSRRRSDKNMCSLHKRDISRLSSRAMQGAQRQSH